VRIKYVVVASLLLFWQQVAQAQDAAIAIIIDDLGNHDSHEQAVRLPGAIACAFLPHTPYTPRLAKLAHSLNKEVILHAPMQAMNNKALGPGSLTLDMSEQEFIETLQQDLASVPHVSGINNHMGSLLTRHPGHMLWLMQEMNRHGDLFFVDSRTTAQSVARMVAEENSVPTLNRDVFLDADNTQEFVEQQFDKLISIAKKRGTALGIGHPYPATIAVLKKRLQQLDGEEVVLVSVSELLRRRNKEKSSWQVSLSR